MAHLRSLQAGHCVAVDIKSPSVHLHHAYDIMMTGTGTCGLQAWAHRQTVQTAHMVCMRLELFHSFLLSFWTILPDGVCAHLQLYDPHH